MNSYESGRASPSPVAPAGVRTAGGRTSAGRTAIKVVSFALIGLFAFGAVVSLITYTTTHQGSIFGGYCMMAGSFGLAWFWGGIIGWRVGRSIMADLTTGTTPVPTPGEIAPTLEVEWGRPATVQEVAAVHQMLMARKHDALLSAGLTLGAVYAIDRSFHHHQ